eukprot:1468193-Prymnesium_polylepis.1
MLYDAPSSHALPRLLRLDTVNVGFVSSAQALADDQTRLPADTGGPRNGFFPPSTEKPPKMSL